MRTTCVAVFPEIAGDETFVMASGSLLFECEDAAPLHAANECKLPLMLQPTAMDLCGLPSSAPVPFGTALGAAAAGYLLWQLFKACPWSCICYH